MALTRDQILARRVDLRREPLDVPELDGTVIIRVFTLAEVHEIQKAQKADPDPMSLYPKLVAMATVNEDGSPVFVGEDVKLVEELPWPAVDAIAKAALRINKMGKDEKDDSPKA